MRRPKNAWRGLTAWSGALLISFGLEVPVSGERSKEERRVETVSIFTTPGKPMALVKPGIAAEEIHAEETADGARMTVIRNVGSEPKDFVEKTFPLSTEEWGKILAVIKGEGLLGWTPDEDGNWRGWHAS